MFDFITTMVGVSFAVLALALTVAAASIVVCVVTLIKNLPKGIMALRAATESSVYALAFCGQSVAEEAWFARLQAIFGRRFLFGMCDIYVSVAKFFAGGAEKSLAVRRRAAGHVFPADAFRVRVCKHGTGLAAFSAPVLKHSAVMKQ